MNDDALIFADKDVTCQGEFVFFWRGWPSQWVKYPFEVEAIHYTCCEQYMMAEKARVFGDSETLGKILSQTSPKAQKALGRMVRGFDETTWASVCRGIVFAGNLAKFQQHTELSGKLLATGTRTLVEASPVDRIWGIGLAADDPRALDPKKWQGRNWLGIALMQVRSALQSHAMDIELQRQLETRRAIAVKGAQHEGPHPHRHPE